MKKHITYAHGRYLKSRKLCSDTALANGGMDISVACGLDDLDASFIRANLSIFRQPRGAGFWLWKPWLILQHLQHMGDQDWLMYTDAGMYFARSPWAHILRREADIGAQGVVTFGWCATNKEYCKRDAFILMGQDESRFADALQRTASIFACRKTEFSLHLLNEWLGYACDPRIITDLPNTQGLPNYPEFKDHRHDQSIMSLLCQKYDTFLLDDLAAASGSEEPYLVHTRDPA